ncbi:MAG: DUF4007 family protein [Desulfobacteraceae bacterium]|nr:DUF4007 family protein [Desulfobacteraceae bacterium]
MVNSIMAEKEKTGHRQRLRERFLAGGPEECSDEMLLELLLTFAIGRKDVRPIAQELVQIFGNLDHVLSASPDELYKVKGLGQSSIALLKVVDFIKSGTISAETGLSLTKGEDTNQLQLFEDSPNGPKPKSSFPSSRIKKPDKKKTPSLRVEQPEKKSGPSTPQILVDTPLKPQRPSRDSKKTPAAKKSNRRKFQISRSHLFEFNHFSRILSFLFKNRGTKRISRDLLIENSGLPDGQVASLISIGVAMDLIQTRSQTLTPIGLIIAEHDIFLEGHGTLEWCHYKGAGSYHNFLWFEVFNHILAEEAAMTQERWQEYFKKKLKGQYSDKTVNDHVPKEIRFIVDAYTKRNFNKLEILHMSTDDQLYRRRYTRFNPLVLTAMIYDFFVSNEAQLFQVGEMAVTPGSPAMVFGLDVALFRQQVEGLHDRGWLRYETTHNLDQIRLKPGFSAIEFLSAHFENREPHEDSNELSGGIFV